MLLSGYTEFLQNSVEGLGICCRLCSELVRACDVDSACNKCYKSPVAWNCIACPPKSRENARRPSLTLPTPIHPRPLVPKSLRRREVLKCVGVGVLCDGPGAQGRCCRRVTRSMYLCVYLSIDLSFYLSTSVSTYRFVRLSASVSICLFVESIRSSILSIHTRAVTVKFLAAGPSATKDADVRRDRRQG